MWFVGRVRFTRDDNGTPGVEAADRAGLFTGLGVLHGRHRPLQSLLITTAGTGRLSEHLVPKADLVRLDAIAHRLDLVRRGQREAERLDEWTAAQLDHFLTGLHQGLAESEALELRLLGARLPRPDRAALISGFLLSAYLGLAEGQERMERAILEGAAAGADPTLLRRMFRPHLDAWTPDFLPQESPPLGFAAHGMAAAGGSNAWAVDGTRSGSGAPMLAGDPHLIVNQLPSLFFEVRLATPDNFWLGVTIPGLPGMAICRTRHIAWSGTFAVADNVDHFIERTLDPAAQPRRAVIARRFRKPLELEFWDSPRGTLERDPPALSTAWSGAREPGEAIGAYLRLLFAESAPDAVKILERAHTLSLHFVIADRATVRYRQNGRIPRRTGGWSGLHPVEADGGRGWKGDYTGDALPTNGPINGMVITANEARLAPDGGVLSTLAQPRYRFDRIRTLLESRRDHSVRTFQAMQLDLYSRQAALLVPTLCAALLDGPLRKTLSAWDLRFAPRSRGATAYLICRRALLTALAPELGGAWFEQMLEDSELPVWWAAALDRLLLDPHSWREARGARMVEALGGVAHLLPPPLGLHQTVTHKNLILGGVGLGFDRGPYPLPGSLSTICQGTRLSIAGAELVVAPAYRFVTDMAEPAIYSTLPGGIDGNRFDPTYARWLEDHHVGRFHRTAAD